MSILASSRIVGQRSSGVTGYALDKSPPTSNELLNTIGAYIPTDVTALYVPVAAGMTAANVDDRPKFWAALVSAGFAVLGTWVLGHRAARKKAQDAAQPAPSPWKSLFAGWYEILVAGLAFFVWATACPDSWLGLDKNSQLWIPAAMVGAASLLFGGVGVLLNRPNV